MSKQCDCCGGDATVGANYDTFNEDGSPHTHDGDLVTVRLCKQCIEALGMCPCGLEAEGHCNKH